MARRIELVAVLARAGCKTRHEPPAVAREAPAITRPNVIPRAHVQITIDGEGEETDWSRRALRGLFLGPDGTQARPASDIRLLHDGSELLVGLYAADEDVRSTDAFALTVGGLAVRIDATGAVTPAIAGIRAAIDRDGTLDDARDDDEEWLIEVAIPFAAIGARDGARLAVHASRCDTPKDGIERCGSWNGELVLE